MKEAPNNGEKTATRESLAARGLHLPASFPSHGALRVVAASSPRGVKNRSPDLCLQQPKEPLVRELQEQTPGAAAESTTESMFNHNSLFALHDRFPFSIHGFWTRTTTQIPIKNRRQIRRKLEEEGTEISSSWRPAWRFKNSF